LEVVQPQLPAGEVIAPHPQQTLSLRLIPLPL
jgi:hypothetical protein